MQASALFARSMAACPLVAIIRGVQPYECEEIGKALVDAGIRIVEVPLNSPDPFRSIERLARRFGDAALVGAGTVLDAAEVGTVRDAGGRIIVSPSVDTDVIAATVHAGLVSVPGYFTPSEAFRALKAGAHALKLFPAEAASPALLKAQRAVLPRHAPVLVVGGVSPETMPVWIAAGADGFGLGSGLYRAGQDALATGAKARRFVAALSEARNG